MKSVTICLAGASLLLVLFSVTTPVAYADGITEEQATAILNELKQIHLLLEKQQTQPVPTAVRAAPPPEIVKIAVGDSYSLGASDAPVTLVEFTDYQCPFCNKFHMNTFPELKKQFLDTSLVRFVSRDLPLEFHKNAFEAARAARCAGEQGRYWEVRDWLSSHPDTLTNEAILNAATQAGVDGHLLQACLESERHREDIRRDVAEANAIGITGTPGFVIGRTTNGVLEGVKILGAQPYGTFESRIKQLLSAGEKP
jgi:protein-disulfide isomerase